MESQRKWSIEMVRAEQKEENEGVLSEGLEGLEFSITDDDEVGEEERGSVPLIEACGKNTAEVRVCYSGGGKVELFIPLACQQMVSLLLIARADVTPCDRSQCTALHECPPELREKVVRWMSRPHMSLQAELLQAAWQGDQNSVQTLLV